MVRVGGLQQKVAAGIPIGSGADRMAPREQLDRISQMVRQMLSEAYGCLREQLLPALEKEGVLLRGPKELTEEQRKHLDDVFRREIFPVLTPLAIDQGHPFPHLLNKSLNLAVLLNRPKSPEKLFRRGAGARRVAAFRALACRRRSGRIVVDGIHHVGDGYPHAPS